MKKIILAGLTTLISSGFLFFQSQPDGLLHVYFLNVGQGDSILIRTPAGKNILVDGGPKQTVLRELKETLPFFSARLDYILLTHPDRDHIEGLIAVLKKYPVGHAIFTGAHKKNYFSDAFFKNIHDKNIPVTIADEHADIEFEDGVQIDILYPFSQIFETNGETNDISIISKVIYGENEVLLTGDAQTYAEEKLLAANAPVLSDVLKVGHHGSKTSSSLAFLNAVSPDYSVISVGKGNFYHHPHPSVMKRLEASGTKILRTDENGRIEFIFSKEGVVAVKTKKS